jgi:Domain of unknown function (DUF6542)
MASASPRESEPIFSVDYVDVPAPEQNPAELAESPEARDPIAVASPHAAVDTAPEHTQPDQPVPPASGEVFVTVWREQSTDEPEQSTDEPKQDVAPEYASAVGMPGRGVILLSIVACAVCALADCALTGTLTMFFDLCFVTICLVGAMAIQRTDLFTAGVLAPLVFGAVVFVVAVGVGGAFVDGGSLSKAFFTGLAAHAGALVAGYGVALGVVGGRVAAARSAWS